jgi:hypothetical protein
VYKYKDIVFDRYGRLRSTIFKLVKVGSGRGDRPPRCAQPFHRQNFRASTSYVLWQSVPSTPTLIICRYVGDEPFFIANKTADHQCEENGINQNDCVKA